MCIGRFKNKMDTNNEYTLKGDTVKEDNSNTNQSQIIILRDNINRFSEKLFKESRLKCSR